MKTKHKRLATPLRMALITTVAAGFSQAAPLVVADNGVNLSGTGTIYGAPAVEGGIYADLSVAAEYILPASAFTGVKTGGGLMNYEDLVPLTTNSITVVNGAGAAVPTGTAVTINANGMNTNGFIEVTDSAGNVTGRFSNVTVGAGTVTGATEQGTLQMLDQSGNVSSIVQGAGMSTGQLTVSSLARFAGSFSYQGISFYSLGGSFYIGSTLVSGPGLNIADHLPDMSVSFTADSIDTTGSISGRVITVGNYSIAKTETTTESFKAVEAWALQNGYADISGSAIGGTNLPITAISYYQALLYCNALSENQGLTPAYESGGAVFRDKGGVALPVVTVNAAANGYRLPTFDEWEYAARSGSNALSTNENPLYAWGTGLIDPTYLNYGESGILFPVAVGSYSPKGDTAEGLQDMSGNLSEWVYEFSNPSRALLVGGDFRSDAIVSYGPIIGKALSQRRTNTFDRFGFRVARNN